MNELTIGATANNSLVTALKTQSETFCTFDATTAEGKKALFNAMNSPDYKLSAFINKTIYLKDVYVEAVSLAKTDDDDEPIVNLETGEVVFENCVRIVLIDADGKSYQSVAKGIYQSCQRLFVAYGQPTWEEPVAVEVRQIPVKRGSMLTLTAV